MKRGMSFLILALIIFIFSAGFNADALVISGSKSSYLPGETFQANISGDFSKPLTVNNIAFAGSQGSEIALAFYLIEINRTKQYYVYVDLPLQSGNYVMSVENALYNESGVLKGDKKDYPFIINGSTALTYKSVSAEVLQKLSSLSVEDTSLALMAFSYDSYYADAIKNSLFSKSRNNECWPLSSCRVKDTALAAMALSELEETENSWLIDARNDLDTGLWSMQANSDISQECEIIINGNNRDINLTQGLNTITLDLKNKDEEVDVRLNCSDI